MLLHALEDDQLGLPQINLLLGLMGLKQTNMIKSGLFCFILDAPTGFLVVASTSLHQMLPTLKFSSSGPLGGTQILARVLNSQFTYLSLHIQYLTSSLKMNPLRPDKDEPNLSDFPAVAATKPELVPVSRPSGSQSQGQSWPLPAGHIPGSPGTKLSTAGQTENSVCNHSFFTEEIHPSGAGTSSAMHTVETFGKPKENTGIRYLITKFNNIHQVVQAQSMLFSWSRKLPLSDIKIRLEAWLKIAAQSQQLFPPKNISQMLPETPWGYQMFTDSDVVAHI